jgi:hypothetical protein
MTPTSAAALEFNLRSEPQLELAHWLESKGVDLSHVLNVAGPIVEHEVVIFPNTMFDFVEPRNPDAIRAVVHVVFDDDAKTPIDLVAWTRKKPCEIFRCLGFAAAIGIDRLFNPASYFAGRPLLVHRSPLAWLAAGCVGMVPIDHGALRERMEWLQCDCRLAAENLAHGRALREALAPLSHRVRILVPRAEAA